MSVSKCIVTSCRICFGEADPRQRLLSKALDLLVDDECDEEDPISMQEAEELARISRPYARQGRPDPKAVWFVALAIKAGLLVLDADSSPSSR
jgi:predicted nucleic acid-binding protein